jgi:hypothetical protein
LKRLLAFAFLLMLSVSTFAAIPWPVEPFDQAQPLGNSYGEYQYYGGFSYVHPGIDILHPFGTHVFAVKAGWVKAVLTTQADLHWRVAIGDSASAAECDGWLYAHLDRFTITVSEGQHVDSGQYLGDLVYWPTADFHHLHFVKIRNSGFMWTSDWQFVGNPLDELVDIADTVAPWFEEDSPGAQLRFCRDNTNGYFGVGEPVNGDVDIIAHAQDLVGHPTWQVAPYAMGYEIYSDSVALGPYVSFVFTGELLWDQVADVIYKEAEPCLSQGDYDYRAFYEIITNHDEDTLVTPADKSGKWATGQIPNDTYTIRVWASDRYGNVAWDSMDVTTENFYDITGTVSYSDGNPDLTGATVQVPFTGGTAWTDAGGTFVILSQPAGRYQIAAERTGYQPVAQTMEVFSNDPVSFVMQPSDFVDGDVNNDGVVNIADVVYLIAFIFGGGPYPVTWAAAVNINQSPIVNVSDAVYLIAYIFGGGSPPGEK